MERKKVRDVGSDSEEREEETSPLKEVTHVQIENIGKKKLIPPGGFVVLLTLVSALGGFLFGYDTGVVSGALIKIRQTFTLDSTWLEAVVSATIAAAAVSAFFSGLLCDWIGRKPTLMIASIIFTIGAILMGVSFHAYMLLIGRIVVGIGIGMAAMSVPMYISESAPAKMRGKLVVVNVLFITGGQFVATIVDGVFSYLPHNIGWRFMLGLAGIPSILMFLGLLFMPESPRWLVFHNREDKARQVLETIRPSREVAPELRRIVEDFKEHTKTKLTYFEMVRKFCSSTTVLLALFVGCGLQLFQQLSGINTVMYYSASIIQMAGFPDQSSIWLAVVPGASNFIFTIVGLLLVDRLGRRKLLIASISGVVFSFLFLSGVFYLMSQTSLPSQPYQNNTCLYKYCGSCIGNSGCGFCADFNATSGDYLNGTCESLVQQNGSTESRYRPFGMKCVLIGEDLNSSLSTDTIFDPDSLVPFNNDEDSMSEAQGSGLHPGLTRKLFATSCPDNKYSSLAIIALFLYIAFFAPGMGPLPWTINSEIYPTWARSTAISIATMTNWMSNLVVSMTFLTMADNLGQPVTFIVYACLSLVGLTFIVLFVPETRGVPLEEVGSLFKAPYFMNWCSKKIKYNRL